MMKNLILFVSLFLSVQSYAQEVFVKGEVISVTLSNQEKIVGRVIEADETYLYLQVGPEKLSIPRKNILYHSSAEESELTKNQRIGEYVDYSDQYFLNPSAMPVGKGKIYYRNIDLVGNLFSFGISDHFSINAGFETVSLFAGQTPFFLITPKFSQKLTDKVHVGLGASALIGEHDSAGFGFGNFTYGDEKNNVTLGLGFASDGDDIIETGAYFLGWYFSLSEKVSLYGDFIGSDVRDNDFIGLLTFNVRIKFLGGVAFDIGTITNNDFDGAIPSLAVILPIK